MDNKLLQMSYGECGDSIAHQIWTLYHQVIAFNEMNKMYNQECPGLDTLITECETFISALEKFYKALE